MKVLFQFNFKKSGRDKNSNQNSEYLSIWGFSYMKKCILCYNKQYSAVLNNL